jgi:UDP-2,4-diacetamido-2,4,6-trideoxy-beta-L-altropyranose hydrolase
MGKYNSLMFRVDASTRIGTGHVMRCLALAQAWQLGGGLAYFCHNKDLPVALAHRLDTENIHRIELQSSPGTPEDVQETITHCQKFHSQCLVLDGYHFDAIYQQNIKLFGLKLLVIDDYGHASNYHADLVLNQNISASSNLYFQIETHTKLLLGCKYALLRREFWAWRDDIRYKLRELQLDLPFRILITLGGSDPDNVTLLVLNALKYLDHDKFKAKVIVGGSNPHLDLLRSTCADFGNSVVLYSDVTNMPKLMSESDLAISAGGSTCWELAFMGIPSLLIILAENQKSIVEGLGNLNISINLGWYNKIASINIAAELGKLINNPTKISQMRYKSLALIDGYGSKRVADSIRSIST